VLFWSLALAAAAAPQSIDPALLTAGVFTTVASGQTAFSLPAAALDRDQLAQFA
jgi:hypothetical protein